MNKKTLACLEEVIDYLIFNERRNWIKEKEPKEHVYHAIKKLERWLDEEREKYVQTLTS